MSALLEVLGWILLIVLIVVLWFWFWPWAVFSSLSLLFGLHIDHSFLSYAAYWVLFLVGASMFHGRFGVQGRA